MATGNVAVGGDYGSSNERAWAHRCVLPEWQEAVYVSCVHSLETTLVPRSLLFVAPVCCLGELCDCRIVLRVSRVSALDSGQCFSDYRRGSCRGHNGDWEWPA